MSNSNKRNGRIFSEKDLQSVFDDAGFIVKELNNVVADYVDNDDVPNVAAIEACIIQGMLVAMSCADDVNLNNMPIEEVADVIASFAAASAIRVYGNDDVGPFSIKSSELFESVFRAMKSVAGLLRSEGVRELLEDAPEIVEIGVDDLPDWLVDEVCKTSGMSREELSSRTRIGIPASIKDEFMSAVASGEVSPDDVGIIFAGLEAGHDGRHDDAEKDSPEEMLRKFREGVS